MGKDLLDAIDVEDLLSYEGIRYRVTSSGTNLNLQECPFCEDKRWRVYFSTEKKTGLCYHGECEARFNLFSFVRKFLDTDNKGTYLYLERYASSSGIRCDAPVSKLTTEGWELPAHVDLPSSNIGHDFLVGRGITDLFQRRYALGYSVDGVYRFTDFEGVCKAEDFSQRIIIPVADLDGVIKTFQGRDVTGYSDKRYRFPSALPGTGRFLYGGHLLTGREHTLVIGEGPFDAIAIAQSIEGVREFDGFGVIGSFGLFIGASDVNADDQISRLRMLHRNGVRRIIFMWDGEKNALNKTLEAANLLSSCGFMVEIALLPPDKDPNEVDTATVRNCLLTARKFDKSLFIMWKLNSPY